MTPRSQAGTQAARRKFYVALALAAVAGVLALGYLVSRPAAAPVVRVDPNVPAGEARGYLLGKPDAPVRILEFADFECPACGNFSVVTEPDVRSRIINAGLANIRYFDFPLPMHKNTWFASNAAACADEQQKFWEMHDRLFRGQGDWNGEATRNPRDVFTGYARELGLNTARWEQCYDAQKYQRRIAANRAEAIRRNINQTPTFIIGDRVFAGALPYDAIKAHVDSAAASVRK